MAKANKVKFESVTISRTTLNQQIKDITGNEMPAGYNNVAIVQAVLKGLCKKADAGDVNASDFKKQKPALDKLLIQVRYMDEKELNLIITMHNAVLKFYENSDVTGRDINRIIDEIKGALLNGVVICRNDKFEIIFDSENKKLLLQTVMSNQNIDKAYMYELNFLNELVQGIETQLLSLEEAQYVKVVNKSGKITKYLSLREAKTILVKSNLQQHINTLQQGLQVNAGMCIYQKC